MPIAADRRSLKRAIKFEFEGWEDALLVAVEDRQAILVIEYEEIPVSLDRLPPDVVRRAIDAIGDNRPAGET